MTLVTFDSFIDRIKVMIMMKMMIIIIIIIIRISPSRKTMV